MNFSTQNHSKRATVWQILYEAPSVKLLLMSRSRDSIGTKSAKFE